MHKNTVAKIGQNRGENRIKTGVKIDKNRKKSKQAKTQENTRYVVALPRFFIF